MTPARLPSPGLARYGMVVLLLATAGLFAGHSVHNAMRGDRWLAVVRGCAAGRPLDAVPADSGDGVAYLSCVSAVEHQRSAYALAGAVAVVLLGAVLMLLLPYRLLLRARPLRPAEPRFTSRAADAAVRLGLRRAPTVLVGNWRLQEPFTVRTLRGIRIVVPPGLRRLPPEQIDAVLRHEVAHVRASDVTLVWLIRGMWWALPPALLVPLVLMNRNVLARPRALIGAPLDLIRVVLGGAYYWNYLLRGLLLLVVAATVAAAVLRSREHEADLAAAAAGDEGLLALLAAQPATRPRPWRRLRAVHPPAATRVAALTDPHRVMELRVLDAAAAGLLIAMMIPVVHMALPADPETGMLRNSAHVTGVIAGTLLALVWGQAVWRAALVAERTGRPLRLRRSTATLAGAMVAGMLAHIAGLPMFGAGLFDNVVMLILLPAVTAAAITLSGALAVAWARRTAGVAPSRRAWPAVVVLNAMLFTGALWIALDVFGTVWAARGGHPGDPHAWAGGLVQGLTYNAYQEGAAVTVAAVGLLAGRWTADRPAARGWFRTVVLVTAPAIAALMYRWMLLSPDADAAQGRTRDFWSAAAAGAVVLALVLARRGPSGLIPGLAVAPAATLIVSAAIWVRYLPHWLHLGGAARLYLTMPIALLAPAFLVAALCTAPFPTPARRP